MVKVPLSKRVPSVALVDPVTVIVFKPLGEEAYTDTS